MESNPTAVVTINYTDIAAKEAALLAQESDSEFTFRFLQRDDIKIGHLKALAQLTVAPEVAESDY